MKRLIVPITLAIAGLLSGCFEKGANPTGSLYRSHFIGTTQLAEGTNALKLKAILALPSTPEIRNQALDKIAKAPFQLWHDSLPSGVTNHADLIRPLLDDLLAAESFIEIKGPSADFDSVVALQLPEQRIRLWNTNLWQLAGAWQLAKPKPLAGNQNGWEVRGRG